MLKPARVGWIFAAAIMAQVAGMVSGQDYPNKPIRIITGFPGAGTDFAARLVANGIAGSLGQPVIVENRNSGVTTELASKSWPDGYTLLVGGNSVWIIPLQLKTGYDPVKDLSAITLISRQAKIIAAHASVPVSSIKELVALAKAKPGVLNYGHGGERGGSRLAMEIFKDMAGINVVHVPYKGATPALNGVLAGEVQLGVFDVGPVMPHVKTGKLKALAVTSSVPSVFAPGVPPLADSGYAGYNQVGMLGVFAPAKTPVIIVNRLNREIVRLLNQPEVKERLFNVGEEVVASSSGEFAAAIKSDMAANDKIIKALGLNAN